MKDSEKALNLESKIYWDACGEDHKWGYCEGLNDIFFKDGQTTGGESFFEAIILMSDILREEE